MNSSIYHKIILLSYHSFNLCTLQTPMSIITRTIETRGSSMWASIARKRFTWKFQNRCHQRYLSKNVWVRKTCLKRCTNATLSNLQRVLYWLKQNACLWQKDFVHLLLKGLFTWKGIHDVEKCETGTHINYLGTNLSLVLNSYLSLP